MGYLDGDDSLHHCCPNTGVVVAGRGGFEICTVRTCLVIYKIKLVCTNVNYCFVFFYYTAIFKRTIFLSINECHI